ncbi:asparagine synthetase B family protein [Micromonospora zhanjiangensis]
MCGIVGWVDFTRDLRLEGATVRAMTATMALRGPDAEGIWLREHVGFGHRRLAVIDLATGDQPMTVERDGRTLAAITYSGEVYNYRELRDELRGRGHEFRTESDTEVVLRAYLEWGEGFVDRLNGMYAFGLWDTREQRLLLVRDRMGIKPLFFFTGLAEGCCSAPSRRPSSPTRRPNRWWTPTACGNCCPSPGPRATASTATCTRCAPAS